MSSWILGISGSHNGAYCLLEGHEIRVAIQEERLVGVKRARVYGGRRGLGLKYCLDAARIDASELSMVVLASQGPSSIEENDIWLNPDLSGLTNVPRRIVSHHLAHAASAVSTSGFDDAAVLVVDGLGSPVLDLSPAARDVVVDPREETSEHLSLFAARGAEVTPLEVHATARWLEKRTSGMWHFFSLGGLYSAVAQQIFGDPNEAGKVMGLAPYGEACIPAEEFLTFEGERLCFPNRVQDRFPFSERWPEHRKEYRDLAASAQHVLEGALLRTAKRLKAITNTSNLCLAGGVALNSVVNQRLCAETGFDDVFVVPAADDGGAAIGAAYLGLWERDRRTVHRRLRTDAHGRTATSPEVERAIRAVPDVEGVRPDDLLDEVVERLTRGQIGGWFQEGSEFGPRALGHRSIVCSPCSPRAKENLNGRVKFREAFRPFAPSVLAHYAADWFEFGRTSTDSPFMLRVVPFRKEFRSRIPAVVHVDGTGRLQTLTASDNGLFYDLVARFHARTGVPMLLNTSMNVRGEPIAESPVDALWCLLGTGLDFCVIHDWLVTRRQGFRTVLDYVPAVVGLEYTLRLNVSSGALESSIRREDAVTVQVTTPWGRADVVLPLRLVPLLSNIDGTQDGHALARGLGADPADLLRDLLLLRRMHIIELVPHVIDD